MSGQDLYLLVWAGTLIASMVADRQKNIAWGRTIRYALAVSFLWPIMLPLIVLGAIHKRDD